MDKLRNLADTFRKRADNLKEVANKCDQTQDRYGLGIRADEAERCAAAIEAILPEEGVSEH